ncbi:MAG: hypothetical protein R3301_14665 [Saprospiraceae bacterium]|nr:hypothetical protein [Saprospiraceae bacterium]
MKGNHASIVNVVALLLLCVLVMPVGSSAQQKYEKEFRIDPQEVPSSALQFVDQLEVNRKVRWYREVGLERSSVEAKTKINGQRYSIEFSNDGQIEDIEIEQSWEEIPAEARARAIAHFDKLYDRHKVLRVQRQYTGPPAVLISCIRQPGSCNGVTRHFELVVKTRTERDYKMMEFLISETGVILSSVEIILRNTDNLEF